MHPKNEPGAQDREKKSKVSVIIPCYDHGDFLGEALDSVFAQTLKDLEVVVVDDGSTEEATLSLLKGLDRPGVRVIRIEHQGLAGARNAGIRASRGEYILPLDADDKIGPRYLEEAAGVLDADDDVKIVYCEAERFGAQSGPWKHPPFSMRNLMINNVIFCTALFRRRDYDKTRGYDTDLKAFEDWDFWLSLLENGGRAHKLPGTYFFYRLRPGSMLQTINEKAFEKARLKIFRNHLALYAGRFFDPINLYAEKTLLQNSYEYRLGTWLLKPVRFLRRKFRGLFRRARARNPWRPAETFTSFVPPAYYHFLMTNFCNARCLFCNQRFDPAHKSEITLDKFKVMASHIVTPGVKEFHLSGGGEPLLAADLLPIIRYINDKFPWIDVILRTNGVLLGKYAEELAALDIARVEISVHGLPATNDKILQRSDSQAVFEGAALLKKYLDREEKKTSIIFEPAVSTLNIDEIPALVQKAAELGVAAVRVYFWRFFQHKLQGGGGALKEEQSLFFDQAHYNAVMLRSRKLAGELGVEFSSEPLFSKRLFQPKPTACCQPWDLVLVDWDGDIYPCTGGEEWFRKKVKSGGYNFGNLLKENVQQFWNNPAYIAIRRTCSPSSKEKPVPECFQCHSTICFWGPDIKRSHLIREKE